MIAPVRQRAGLSPITLYYNNNNESINSKIKREMQGKRCYWPTFVKSMKQINAKQQRNVDRAVFDEGSYTFKPNVKALGASSAETSRLTEKQRAAILRRFYDFVPICEMRESSPEELVEDESSDSSDQMATSPCPPFSVPYQALDLPPILYDEMWSKAAHLVNEKGSIVSAPHSCTSWMVASASSIKPNFVTKNKNRRFSCDCRGYHEKELCSHVLAVAEENGCLHEMLTLTTASSKRGPSLTTWFSEGCLLGLEKKLGHTRVLARGSVRHPRFKHGHASQKSRLRGKW